MKLSTKNPILEFETEHEKLTESLSAAVFVEDHLWVACDELTSVERLSPADGTTFSNHESFALQNFIDLPAQDTGFDQEIDIEGLDYKDSYLWIVGSHSIKRKKVDDKDSGSVEKKIKKLAKTEIEGNRFILARVPLLTSNQELMTENPERTLKAGQLEADVKSNALVDAIRDAEDGEGDPHLASFLTIPGKDNGFDIEGLAVAGDRIFMGLRGPVLRGWAGILEVAVEQKSSRLALKGIGPKGRPYRKHFLDLKGLGIRDLCLVGSDMLILAGPTMNLDGPVAIFRWSNAIESTEEQLVFSNRLKRLFEVPAGDGTDHAEGMALVPGNDEPRRVLIVYDSPSVDRKPSARAVKADVFELPAA